MKAQLKYADKRNAKIALIIGDDEIENNNVTIKDLNKGAELSKDISKNEEWRSSKDTQVNVPQSEMIKMIKSISFEFHYFVETHYSYSIHSTRVQTFPRFG